RQLHRAGRGSILQKGGRVHPATNPDERERRLDDAVTSWIKANEQGAAPDPNDWLARYSDLAPELESFFAAEDQLGRMAATARVRWARHST
ncbi:MAG: hypothetical protein ACREHD_31225, partial [Pirellulales bacterium]